MFNTELLLLMRLLRRVVRLSRRRSPMRAVGLLLLVLCLVGVRVGGIRLLLLRNGLLVLLLRLLGRISGGGLLRVGVRLLLLRGVGGGGLLLVARLLVRRVHLRLVLLLVGVLRVRSRGRVLRREHRGALRLHLNGGVVDRGLLVLLAPEAVGVAVEHEGRDEEEPGGVLR